MGRLKIVKPFFIGNYVVKLFFLFCIFFPPKIAQCQSWQQTLEGVFDYVETFDQLQDWSGSKFGDVIDKNDMPKKLDGSASIWEYYSFWGSNYSNKWIGDHGSANVWGGTGKSLVLDYVFASSGFISDLGPSRLAFSIGNKPSDGYPEEVYVFSMNKYNKAFFPTSGNDFLYTNFLKVNAAFTGFRDINEWGTVEEQAAAGKTTQIQHLYGLNYVFMNFHGSTSYSTIKSQFNPINTTSDSQKTVLETFGIFMNTDLGPFILNGDWFGIEYHFVKSNPAGAANGLIEAWVYDENGNVLNHDSWTGVTFRDGATSFNHSWNKFEWGGNRGYNEFVYGVNNCTESHCYVDDIIVNGTRIGPKYFSLLNSGGDTTPPNPPTGLRVEP